ncbi:MAG: phospholipase C [Polyangiales bacterium]
MARFASVLPLALLFAPIACTSGAASTGTSNTNGDASADVAVGTDSGASIDADDGVPDTAPSQDAIAQAKAHIKHVVVIVKENHTFDNYFGSFPGANGNKICPDGHGGTGACGHAPDRTPHDLCHEHSCALTDWNGGAMNGWDLSGGSATNGDTLHYEQYQQTDIPNYWQYASTFTLADNFYSSMLGPSFPGHTFFLAAQAGWATGNPNTTLTHPYWGCDQSSGTLVSILQGGTCNEQTVFPCFKIPSVPDLRAPGVAWKFYGSDFYLLPEIWSMFDAIDGIRNGPGWSNVVNATQFDTDVDAKALPPVSWLVDQDFADEHPAVGGVCDGENWTVARINKIMQSDYWNDTLILFAMDDFGGWYDHVRPPVTYGCDDQHPYGLGFRLPLIVISTFAKPAFIFHEQAEQASIPKLLLELFGTGKFLSDVDPAARDGQANDLLNTLDFTQTPLAPLVLKTRTCL